ncbi:MAG: EamA family transporter [Acidobacteriota bacterium]|nr:EamA family transporter [Acidobacteriota bacterium]
MPYLILVSIVWGFSFVIIKGTLVSLDASFVSLARLLLSLLVFLPFLRFAGLSLYEKLQLLLIGGIQFGLMYIAYVAAFQYLPAHVIALMTTTTPLFVAVFNDILAGKIHKRFFFAALLAVAGGAIIELPDQSLEASVRGIVLIQLSNAAFAFGQLAYKKWMASRPDLRDARIFGLLYAGAVLVAGAFSLAITDYGSLRLQPQQTLALLYLGVVASGICFFLWNRGACRVNEGVLAVMNNLKIPIGVVASLFLLQETTDYMRLLLGCVLFGGALWINHQHS